MDLQLALTAATFMFVVILEITIVTFSYRGAKAALDLQKKLAPIITVLAAIPDEEMVRLGQWMKRKSHEWSEAERRLEEEGL